MDAFLRAIRFVFPFAEEEFLSIEKTAEEMDILAAYEEVVALLEVLQESMFLTPVHMAGRYVRIQQSSKALEQVELGLKVHDQSMPYIAGGFNKLDLLYDNPRFLSIMEELDLPMPEN